MAETTAQKPTEFFFSSLGPPLRIGGTPLRVGNGYYGTLIPVSVALFLLDCMAISMSLLLVLSNECLLSFMQYFFFQELVERTR